MRHGAELSAVLVRTSIAGMAQRNPLVHYTKKIVADATEHQDRNGPKNETGMVSFLSTNEERRREGYVPGTQEPLPSWFAGWDSIRAGGGALSG
jgi:hypothetical protein